MKNLSNLVEANIDSVVFEESTKEIRLNLTSPWENKQRHQIIATAIEDFVIDQMRISNIVDRINLFSAENFNESQSSAAELLFYLLRGVEPEPDDLKWDVLEKKLEEIKQGKLTLLEVEPVYGARIVILAQTIKVQ